MTTLSDTYTFRPMTLEDGQAVVDLINADSMFFDQHPETNLESCLADWQAPVFDMKNCTLLAVDRDQNIVGYAELWDINQPYVKKYGWGVVHPGHAGRGIGTAFLSWIETSARARIHLCPDGTRVALQEGIHESRKPGLKLLEDNGFSLLRRYYTMMIKMKEPPAAPVIPDGITIRPIREDEETAFFRVIYDSFHDHWGFVEQPFDQYVEHQKYIVSHLQGYDFSLWYGAFEGNKLIGACLGLKSVDEFPNTAWIEKLGTLREARGKGVGLALLLTCFGEVYRRGIGNVGLGVDASSLTGATRLYEKAGMHVLRNIYLYDKELRPGKDLAVQTVD
ncbi:MAG TPA: GNAT family N-acetyltransferase [Anaerolineaceae bacterium]|nr:GNAT family N-acetyltransferase [Anaerolineaceae bacterium]HPN51089.1 GNAT family N-acetyltransferase [Anaerolineaceae bacterium]